MTQYHISATNPNRHFIDIKAIASTFGKETMVFQLPAWRPGRYELANYAQNIQSWKAYNEDGDALHSQKLSKDSWEVQCKGAENIIIEYNYYAYQLDAGASYYDESQLYVNPINCLLYNEENIEKPCKLTLTLPKDFQIASALKFNENNVAETSDFHQLADSPFIASNELLHNEYLIGEYQFHIWIKGAAKPDWKRILHDFSRFSKTQIEMFGELPVKEYHFLYQLPNVKFYHGVEHLDSTVICLGPAFRLMEKDMYTEVLGISSHELFHSWNIKSIRPVEMYPYDYSKENYSNLGYVAEGVTTYYGDLMLMRSGVFTFEDYAMEMGKFINKHFHNYGRLYQNLAESSFDTWLDGYKPGVPDRKISMYVKGMIVAFMTDMGIRTNTNNFASLDSVLIELYHNYAKKNRGYSEQDYLKLVSGFAGKDYRDFFEKFVWGLLPVETQFEVCLEYIGCELMTKDNPNVSESRYGFKIKEEQNKCVIIQIAPESPADESMLSLNDEIIAVNNLQCDKNNLDELLKHFENDAVTLSIFRGRNLNHVQIKHSTKSYFPNYFIHKRKAVNESQKTNFSLWSGTDF